MKTRIYAAPAVKGVILAEEWRSHSDGSDNNRVSISLPDQMMTSDHSPSVTLYCGPLK